MSEKLAGCDEGEGQVHRLLHCPARRSPVSRRPPHGRMTDGYARGAQAVDQSKDDEEVAEAQVWLPLPCPQIRQSPGSHRPHRRRLSGRHEKAAEVVDLQKVGEGVEEELVLLNPVQPLLNLPLEQVEAEEERVHGGEAAEAEQIQRPHAHHHVRPRVQRLPYGHSNKLARALLPRVTHAARPRRPQAQARAPVPVEHTDPLPRLLRTTVLVALQLRELEEAEAEEQQHEEAGAGSPGGVVVGTKQPLHHPPWVRLEEEGAACAQEAVGAVPR